MDTNQILSLLIAERDRLNQAIAVLQGRSPGTAAVTKGTASATGTRGAGATTTKRKIVRTPEQRAAQAERMRAYWANRNKATAKKATGAKKAAKKES